MTNFENLKSMSIDDFALFLTAERTRMVESAFKAVNKEIPPAMILGCAMVIRTWLEAEVEEDGR